MAHTRCSVQTGGCGCAMRRDADCGIAETESRRGNETPSTITPITPNQRKAAEHVDRTSETSARPPALGQVRLVKIDGKDVRMYIHRVAGGSERGDITSATLLITALCVA
jgi:hypothetical protein